MNADLGAIKAQIVEYAGANGFYLFRCESRSGEPVRCVYWDAEHHPDVRDFLAAATYAGQKMLHLHDSEFDSEMMDAALEQLEDAPLSREEKRELDKRLDSLRMYAGFTCAVELSFDFNGNVYIFELKTDWYEDYLEVMDELEAPFGSGEIEDSGGPLGGYYSQN